MIRTQPIHPTRFGDKVDFGRLEATLDGRLTLPGNPDWEAATHAWNLAVDQRPLAVAEPVGVEDVVAIVGFARDQGLRVSVQSTGHAAAALDPLDRTILIKTGRMRTVQVDPIARRARVEPGVTWSEVAAAAAPHGLAGLAGSSGSVGVAGYSLSGGLGWLGRKHGLASSSIRSLDVVTADGRFRPVDAAHEPELFWALRGGGGSFGIVTGIEFDLFPVEALYGGAVFFPWERSREVLGAWLELVRDLPEETTSIARILQVPDLEEIPPGLRGRSLVTVDAAHLGDEAGAAPLVESLRALGPEIDTFGTMAIEDLQELHMEPPSPTPVTGDGMLLDGVSTETVEALLDLVGPGSGSTLQSVELRKLGGALGRRDRDAGALTRLDGEFLLFAAGVTPQSDLARRVHAQVDAVKVAMGTWDAGRRYLNFATRLGDSQVGFASPTYRRLRAAKSEYDPGDLILAKHSIPPLEGPR